MRGGKEKRKITAGSLGRNQEKKGKNEIGEERGTEKEEREDRMGDTEKER